MRDATEALQVHEAVKPRLRGVFHEVAFFVALIGLAALVTAAHGHRAALAGLVYGLSLAGMLGMSALYHRRTWSLAARRRLRGLDHAGIFLLIAGTYTPVCLLGVPGTLGTVLLWVVWSGAALGIVHAFFFVHAFRAFNALLYVVLGCAAVPVMPWLWSALGPTNTLLLAVGGAVYIAGAFVYARRWPNPAPKVFGYHEVFHAFTLVAGSLHFAAVMELVRAAR